MVRQPGGRTRGAKCEGEQGVITSLEIMSCTGTKTHFGRRDRRRSTGAEPQISESGVDLTLVRWMCSMTPTERLRVLQGAVDSLMRLRRGRSDA